MDAGSIFSNFCTTLLLLRLLDRTCIISLIQLSSVYQLSINNFIFYSFISGEIFTVLEISFFWGLLLICTHQSYLTRKVTNNAHGLRYIFFGSLALSINAMTMILAQSFTDNKGNKKELMCSFYNLFFATVTLACTFLPKVDILVFHPEKDVLFDALRTTTIKSENSMINMRERIKSVTQTAGPSGTREG